MLISVSHAPMSWRGLGASLVSRNALIGLTSGTLFGIAAVAYRAASLSLGGPNFMMQAATTLFFTILLQTVIMLGWMLWRDPTELQRIGAAWKPALFTGFVGATASFGWFAAMTLQQAAIVKALAQVEMIFAFASSVFFFRERINATEIVGCLLIVAGIVALVMIG
jgi:drug/metabolite transporter (DMT)-like permease